MSYLQLLLLIPINELSLEDRRHLGAIMRCILQLNSSPVYSYVSRDPETLAQVASSLEYDFDTSLAGSSRRERPPLASFIAQHTSRYIEVVPFPSHVTAMIHRHYRLVFVRDTLLGEEVGVNLSNLASLIGNLSTDLCLALLDDPSYLESVVSVASDGSDDALRFFKEFLTLCSRTLQQERRVELLTNAFSKFGAPLVSCLESAIRQFPLSVESSDRSHPAVIAVEVTTLLAQLCPGVLVANILQTTHPSAADGLDSPSGGVLLALLKILCEGWVSEAVEAAADAIRYLLDGILPPSDKDRMVSTFYEHYIRFCIPTLDMSGYSAQSLCSLLSTFATMHSYRMKYFVMRNAVLSRVLSCLDHHYRVVSVEVIRFVRTILGLKDDFYYRHIVKGDLLKQMFQALEGKDALVTSMILEILEYVREAAILPVMEYIVSQYASHFEGILHADSFDRLRLRYEQLTENNNSCFSEQTEQIQQRGRDRDRVIQDEDAYFDSDDLGASALQILQGYSDSLDEGEGPCVKRLKQEELFEPFIDVDEQPPPLPPLRPKYANDDDIAPIFLLKNVKGKPLIADELERRPVRPTISFSLTTKRL